jgi:hypothetical protein
MPSGGPPCFSGLDWISSSIFPYLQSKKQNHKLYIT